MGQLQQFLDADAGVPQGFDDGPSPEGVLVLAEQLDAFAASFFGDEDCVRAVLAGAAGVPPVSGPAVGSPGVLEGLADGRVAGASEQGGLVVAVLLCRVDQHGQVGQALADALVHLRCPRAVALGDAFEFAAADRAADRPWCPGRVFVYPFLDVEVERPDAAEDLQAPLAGPGDPRLPEVKASRAFQASATSDGRSRVSMPGWCCSMSAQNVPARVLVSWRKLLKSMPGRRSLR
ncbi:hypothetical protein QFZ82_007663 [Streptomyces sp. V4I23]|uniref:hypothetical protein n=1 Tax=Streptomyces sp. V4I23 TaxID=3042282 RepID=UPI002784C7BB|nr:hypothetical protein [Streptomyces sp. V4I23]MDQ1013178.1 hypothetical protein [Streptomyces sp. V4I23]